MFKVTEPSSLQIKIQISWSGFFLPNTFCTDSKPIEELLFRLTHFHEQTASLAPIAALFELIFLF